MNALNSSFGFTIIDGDRTFSLREGRHFCMYPSGRNRRFGEGMSHHQIDLLRISMAIHAADGAIPSARPSTTCDHRVTRFM